MPMTPMTDQERELLDKMSQVYKRATPEQKERLIMAVDMLNLLGSYIYEPSKKEVVA